MIKKEKSLKSDNLMSCFNIKWNDIKSKVLFILGVLYYCSNSKKDKIKIPSFGIISFKEKDNKTVVIIELESTIIKYINGNKMSVSFWKSYFG
jgi:hypothetical protein